MAVGAAPVDDAELALELEGGRPLDVGQPAEHHRGEDEPGQEDRPLTRAAPLGDDHDLVVAQQLGAGRLVSGRPGVHVLEDAAVHEEPRDPLRRELPALLEDGLGMRLGGLDDRLRAVRAPREPRARVRPLHVLGDPLVVHAHLGRDRELRLDRHDLGRLVRRGVLAPEAASAGSEESEREEGDQALHEHDSWRGA